MTNPDYQSTPYEGVYQFYSPKEDKNFTPETFRAKIAGGECPEFGYRGILVEGFRGFLLPDQADASSIFPSKGAPLFPHGPASS